MTGDGHGGRAGAGRWVRAGAAVALLTAAAGCGTAADAAGPPTAARTAARAGVGTATPARPATARPAPVRYPADGHGTWTTAPASARTAGTAGPLLRYRVRVERDIRGLPVAGVAATVEAALADRRGWTAGGARRLRRVGAGDPADFTIWLATPGTRNRLCAGTDGYTSCRNGDRVVLNVARWVKGVPGFGAPLGTYRLYLVNHEVGHRLGHGHELCPRPGAPAPVMQQQTLGLHGCRANPWPYRAGRRWTGPAGAYDDPIPPADRGVPAR